MLPVEPKEFELAALEQPVEQQLAESMFRAPFSDVPSEINADSSRLHALQSEDDPGILKATPRTAVALSARLQTALEQQLQATGLESTAAGVAACLVQQRHLSCFTRNTSRFT
jgi:hypothetical protein